MDDASGRTVVITGGSRGIGRSIAYRFAAEKGNVIIVHYDPDESASEETVQHIRESGATAESHKVDVASFEAVDVLFKNVLSRFDGVDVLVNNAGITQDTLLMRMSEAQWDAVLNINLKSVFNCTHAVIREMVRRKGGRIVNISSVVGQTGNAGQANYSASKAGILGFTKSIAKEVGARGITVNAVAPGFIETEMTEGLPEKAKKAFLAQIPLGRPGTTEEIAEAVYWLCSNGSRYITGQVLHVNGGMFG
ncbi:MAG: 3-oxoacyl-[acyl-carrier-protein] reductase [Deltaproteobacteria bacterium]|nr:3-oxoacyl-[acyl-carrier-protein] reductase [Deltaproteobacteria bacterium]